MELDTKQKVLLALYTEYQKDLPKMTSVNYKVMEMEYEVFHVAISKLVNEGYINGATEIRKGGSTYSSYRLDNCMLTNKGIEYVQSKLEIEPSLSGTEKIKAVTGKLAQWGFEQFKDVVVKIASETIKGSIGGAQ